jgi:hypothetical protein
MRTFHDTGRAARRAAWIAAALSALLLGACSDDDDNERVITGEALSVLNKVAQPNRDFVVVDLAKLADADPDNNVVAQGTSDIEGAFRAKVGLDVDSVLVNFPAVEGEPRTSGLISLIEGNPQRKTLEDFTDIACAAGAGAVGDGSVEASAMDRTRIANLELGAQQVLSEQSVDFNDPDSLGAAVARVREITNDGDNPPPS